MAEELNDLGLIQIKTVLHFQLAKYKKAMSMNSEKTQKGFHLQL